MTDPQANPPWRDGYATDSCPICDGPFPPGRTDRQYCSEGCRKTAWRRRHQAPVVAAVVLPPGRPRRPVTVYECHGCGHRALGDQYCPDCSTWMSRIGIGGCCPNCDEPVAITELIDTNLAYPPT